MKKIFFVALAIGSITAYANSSFELEIEISPTFLGESKNYETKYINQDLTVSIVKPQFSNPTGNGNMYLSENSDLNGVCKLYGLTTYVPNSRLSFDAGRIGNNVVIDARSKFKKFESSSNYYAIDIITCNPAEARPVPVSDNLSGKFINDDGSVTVKIPKFLMNGKNLNLSASSDLNGVCKLYGLTTYVPESGIPFVAGTGSIIEIDNASRFRDSVLSYKYYAIDSLICR